MQSRILIYPSSQLNLQFSGVDLEYHQLETSQTYRENTVVAAVEGDPASTQLGGERKSSCLLQIRRGFRQLEKV